MSHRHGSIPKPPFRVREAFPRMVRTPEGMQIICPFCSTPHPIIPGEPSTCGTTLKLTAEQKILSSRITRVNHIKCLKCHNDGGEMVPYMTGFIHLQECNPETRLLPYIPRFNRMAGLIFRLPDGLRKQIEKVTGRAQAVHKLDQDGKDTGQVLGHFFMRKPPKRRAGFSQEGVGNV